MTTQSRVSFSDKWDKDPWFRFPRAFIRDSRLAGNTRGLAAWLASHSTNYRFTVQQMTSAGFGGRDKVRKALSELEQYGYLTRARERSNDGTLGHIDYILHPEPEPPSSGPAPEQASLDPENPAPEQASLDSTCENNESPQVGSTDWSPGTGEPGTGGQGAIRETQLRESNKEEQKRSVSDDDPADSGAGDVSEAAPPRSDAPSETPGFSPEDIRGCVKDPGEVSDGDAVVVAKRADEVVGWGFTRDQVCELLAGARKRSIVKEFLARTASPDEVSAALSGRKDVPGARPDVDELCELLADGVARNGYNRPTIDREWRKQARLLLDTGYALQKKIDLEGAKRVLDWAMGNQFWGAQGNIKSMGTFREKFERVAGQAREEHKKRRGGGSSGGRQSRQQQTEEAIRMSSEATLNHVVDYFSDPNGKRLDVRSAAAANDEEPREVDGDTSDSLIPDGMTIARY